MTTPAIAVTLDASVIINAVNPAEAGHTVSEQVLTFIQAQGVAVIVPALVVVEVAATISQVLNDAPRAQAFAYYLSRLPIIRLIPLSRKLALAAANLAALHRLRGADAVYPAVAQHYGTTLVSLDGEHLRRLAGIVPVLTPADALAMVLQSRPSGPP